MDMIPFAKTNFRNKDQIFGIKTDDRRRHMYVIGKTGTGKSTLLKNMMISDIIAGHGVGIIDPHGEFAETILKYIPKNRIKDVVYFNPADMDFPIAFNIIENVGEDQRHLVASGLIGIFKKLWSDSWGPRLEYVLRNTILALLECPDSTLLGIMRMLSDKDYRKKVIDQVTDPVIKAFWTEEYAKYSSKFEVEAVAPIQNKVGQFLTNPLIRNIVGQKKSSINIREIIDSQKILIVNVSKGRIGEDTAKLLGAMIITKIQQAAMSRIDVPEDQRKDFFLYIDEFQNFATDSFADILSEARKYRLSLILAHQYINQLEEEVRDAVMGNMGTLIAFRVGAEDAEFLEKEFSPEISAEDLVNIPNHKIYLKLMIDGVTSRAFSADTLPPFLPEEDDYEEEILKLSREKYSTKKSLVQSEISDWSQAVESEDKPKVKLYDTECSRCKKTTQVPFEPDPNREVYCKDCYAIIQKDPSQAVSTKKINKKDEDTIKEPEENKNEKGAKKSSPSGKNSTRTTEGELKIIDKDIENKKEISLMEAFSKEPKSFSASRNHSKKEEQTDDTRNKKTEGTIKPGETVKF
jgi:CxxC-x17-CxxC domain-containing protein